MCVLTQRKRVKLGEKFGDPLYAITVSSKNFQKAKVLTFENAWKAPLHMMLDGDVFAVLKHEYIPHYSHN